MAWGSARCFQSTAGPDFSHRRRHRHANHQTCHLLCLFACVPVCLSASLPLPIPLYLSRLSHALLWSASLFPFLTTEVRNTEYPSLMGTAPGSHRDHTGNRTSSSHYSALSDCTATLPLPFHPPRPPPPQVKVKRHCPRKPHKPKTEAHGVPREVAGEGEVACFSPTQITSRHFPPNLTESIIELIHISSQHAKLSIEQLLEPILFHVSS